MNYINTVKELVDVLAETDLVNFPKVIKNIRFTGDHLGTYATWIDQDYSRNCLARTPNYEIILLCWDVDSKTPIHGHDEKDCWVYQLQGSIEEKRYQEHVGNLSETHRMKLTPGKLTYMHDRMGYHSIENNSGKRAMTLHIYASPIDQCEIYNDEKGCFELKEMSYHTFEGLEVPVSVH